MCKSLKKNNAKIFYKISRKIVYKISRENFYKISRVSWYSLTRYISTLNSQIAYFLMYLFLSNNKNYNITYK